jgi:hypothetical protein
VLYLLFSPSSVIVLPNYRRRKSGEKKNILSFTSNVDTVLEVTDPNQGNKLYKFVLTCICGEPRTAIAHRNLDNWAEVQDFF